MFGISEIFGESPFKALYQHMLKVKDCVEKLPELKDAFIKNDQKEITVIFEEICKLEHKADIVKQQIRNHLPKTYFMPVDRGDVLSFLTAQDAIADAVEDVAVLLTMRKTQIPQALNVFFEALFDRVYETCCLTFEAGGEIKQLAETGFGGYEASKVSGLIEKVEEKEWRADKAQMRLSKKLFEVEDETDPVSILMIDKIIVRLGKIANNAETAADIMRSMLTKKK